MKSFIPILALAFFSLAACQNENTDNNNNNADSGAYVNPTAGSEGMTIPDRDTPYIETNSPQLMERIDTAMENNADTPPQAY